jgi:hypothetical protein
MIYANEPLCPHQVYESDCPQCDPIRETTAEMLQRLQDDERKAARSLGDIVAEGRALTGEDTR